MLLIQIFEITADDTRSELFHDVLEATFGEREDLLTLCPIFDWLRDELDGCAPVDREQVDQCLERDALCRFEATELPRPLLVIGPRNFDIGSQRSQQDVDEVSRGGDQVLASALSKAHELGRARTHHLQRLASGLRRIRRQSGGKRAEDIALSTHLAWRTPR